MSKKKIIMIIIGLMVLVMIMLGIYLYFMMPSSVKNNDGGTNQQKTKTACQFFTLSDAKKIIGETVTASSKNDSTAATGAVDPASADKLKDAPKSETTITSCTYLRVPEQKTETSQSSDNNSATKPAPKVEAGDTPTPASSSVPVPNVSGVDGSNQSQPRTGNEIPILITVRSSDQAQAKKDYKATWSSSVQKITGIGEDAYWKTGKSLSGGGYGQLNVLQGENIILISAGENELDLTKKIAEIVISRL